jgi:hypothetical protein
MTAAERKGYSADPGADLLADFGRWTTGPLPSMNTAMKTPRQNPPSQADRKDRLKAALKANIAKRKTQAKSKQSGANPETEKSEAKEE